MNPEETPQPPVDQPVAPESVPTQPSAPDPEQAPRIHNSKGSIEAMTSPGERVIFQTKKHPFGLVVMYIQSLIGFGIVSGLLLMLTPDLVAAESKDTVRGVILLGLVIFGFLLALIMLLVTYIYNQNKLILTNRNVTQIIQNGLFSRQVSELALNNVEDVTSDKEGIWATIFNFGQVRVETAGEQNNFHFQYCPNPNYYGQQLLDARQQCLRNTNPPH